MRLIFRLQARSHDTTTPFFQHFLLVVFSNHISFYFTKHNIRNDQSFSPKARDVLKRRYDGVRTFRSGIINIKVKIVPQYARGS